MKLRCRLLGHRMTVTFDLRIWHCKRCGYMESRTPLAQRIRKATS